MTTPVITGVGHYLPPRVVSNEDLPASLEASPEWIVKRTGIETRRYVEGRVSTSDLACNAALAALDDARLAVADVDCIVAATLSPDHMFPGLGVYTQRKLGATVIPAYDVRAQCSGFLYALNMARAFVLAGTYQRILVVGAEIQSRALGRTRRHRHVTPLFADGAGAVVVTAAEAATGSRALAIDYVKVFADGAGADALRMRIWDASIDPWLDWSQVCESPDEFWYPEMDGQLVFRNAVAGMTDAARQALRDTGLKLEDVRWILPHQANFYICESVATALKVPMAKVRTNIQRYGNTTAASIPILLSETLADGLVDSGDHLLALAFGSGFTWGAAVLTSR